MDGTAVNTNYHVKDNQEVFLGLKVGDAQIGVHVIRLNLKPVESGELPGNVDKLKIGKGTEIKSKSRSPVRVSFGSRF